jgi:hypothetical protein
MSAGMIGKHLPMEGVGGGMAWKFILIMKGKEKREAATI